MGVRPPLLGRRRPAHAPVPSARPPAPQTSPTRAAATSGDWGVTRAGQDWGEGEERHQQRGNTRSLDPIGKEGPVLPPPTCSRLRLAPARRSWTITYRFPASAANTWERIAPARAPPRLAGAHPSHLTAEAQPWRALIGAAGRASGPRGRILVSDWTGRMSLSAQDFSA